MRAPGRWLRTAAARLCAKQTMDRAIDPIVADIRTEYEEAIRTGHRRRGIWICVSGYLLQIFQGPVEPATREL